MQKKFIYLLSLVVFFSISCTKQPEVVLPTSITVTLNNKAQDTLTVSWNTKIDYVFEVKSGGDVASMKVIQTVNNVDSTLASPQYLGGASQKVSGSITATRAFKLSLVAYNKNNIKITDRSVQIKVLDKPVDLPVITDIDGNVYHWVTIDTHTWMVENYKCTKFTDGTAIADFEWAGGNIVNKPYGGYYSWYDVTNPKFAPAGSHVATNQEWTDLWNYVKNVSNPIKESGTIHWNTDNGTNETGFTALGSGHKYGGADIKSYATWWTSDVSTTNPANGIRWYIQDTPLNYFKWVDENGKDMIFSVRLVKD